MRKFLIYNFFIYFERSNLCASRKTGLQILLERTSPEETLIAKEASEFPCCHFKEIHIVCSISQAIGTCNRRWEKPALIGYYDTDWNQLLMICEFKISKGCFASGSVSKS